MSRLDTAKERIIELEGKSIETSQTQMQEKKEWKKATEHSRTITKGLTSIGNINNKRKEQRRYLK